MTYPKKSLGQNFLIDKNIINKIINLVKIKDRHIVEIGSGKGALTNEILKKKPRSLMIIEKDKDLFKDLIKKYSSLNNIKIYNSDILKINIENIIKPRSIVFGNLPYNISSQILIKFIKFDNWPPNFTDLVFMFQKELGDKILGQFKTKNYSRISIMTNYRLVFEKKFSVSPNCFYPKPKVNSLVIHFSPKFNKKHLIKNLNNLEKITNIFFSKKRKMINKSIFNILSENDVNKIPQLSLNLRPEEVSPEIFYRITEFFEREI